MPRRIHTGKEQVKAAALTANVDLLGGGAALEQLSPRHNTVLAACELGD